MIPSTPPEPIADIKIPLWDMAPRDRARMACHPRGLPSYLWSHWKSALKGVVTWQEFQSAVRRSRWDFADWVAGTTTWNDACQSIRF